VRRGCSACGLIYTRLIRRRKNRDEARTLSEWCRRADVLTRLAPPGPSELIPTPNLETSQPDEVRIPHPVGRVERDQRVRAAQGHRR
jgi:hypothetical protein